MTAPVLRSADGKFARGTRPGPGRKKGRDLRTIVEERARQNGTDIDTELGEVFFAQLARAKNGDTQAAKFIVAHLCDTDVAEAPAPLRDLLRRATETTDD